MICSFAEAIRLKEFNLNVGRRIRKLREERRYSREKLAEMAEMNDKFLYEVEVGKKGLSAEKLYKLAQSLDTSVEYLASGQQDNKSQLLYTLLIDFFHKNSIRCIEDLAHKIVEFTQSDSME